jgi:hypothetical protein
MRSQCLCGANAVCGAFVWLYVAVTRTCFSLCSLQPQLAGFRRVAPNWRGVRILLSEGTDENCGPGRLRMTRLGSP